MEFQLKDYNTAAKPDWCPGCGNFGIQMAVKQALTGLQLDPDRVAYVSDIGCSGKIPHWVNTYGLHSLHGRAIPVATGVKLANRDLQVLVSAGDGGAYGIGMGHLVHAIRQNINVTYLVHHNMVYGLTKGQMTPTSPKGYVSPSSPFGTLDEPLNPISLALSLGCGFVARGFVGNLAQLTGLIEAGLQYPGFALIDIMQPCVTFNKHQTFAWFQQHTYNLSDLPDYDSGDWKQAMEKAVEKDRLPLGIFYRQEMVAGEETTEEKASVAAVDLPIENIDISHLMQKYY
jgi:2-oxoglutarate ferredoxin oxidoreductase subunit beta